MAEAIFNWVMLQVVHVIIAMYAIWFAWLAKNAFCMAWGHFCDRHWIRTVWYAFIGALASLYLCLTVHSQM